MTLSDREALKEWTFEAVLKLRGEMILAKRSTSVPGRIFVEGDYSAWPIQPKKDKHTPQPYFSRDDWTLLLGWAMFDLPPTGFDTKYSPTYRSLISYLIRRGQGAYLSPFSHHPN